RFDMWVIPPDLAPAGGGGAAFLVYPQPTATTSVEGGMAVGRLDFLYTPSSDLATDARQLLELLGGMLEVAIDDGGTRVAMVSFGTPPAILITDHLEGGRTIHVLAVDDLDATVRTLAAAGWTADRTIELPPGPAATYRAPGGVRFALYEATRGF